MQCRRSLPCVIQLKQLKSLFCPYSVHAHRAASTLAERIAADTTQSYLSSSRNAFVNLSFEHHLLQQTPPESAVLFIYINRPCVVIGRNQNPWAEVNLLALKDGIPGHQTVDLVRRRSGGGTVFHDLGNVNWTVISPAKTFTRDKHVEMIVRALRSCGIERARVNERHDIVMDTAELPTSNDVDPHDTHLTRFTSNKQIGGREQTVKVSGSAYKLTRGRALHHGTCLLRSPFLGRDGALSKLLRAPGQAYITAKGVESVRSPVDNVGISPELFIHAVRAAFADMYSTSMHTDIDESHASSIEAVRKGMAELRTAQWIFGQTPHFSVSIASPSKYSDMASELLPGTNINFDAKHGEILDGSIKLPSGKDLFGLIKGLNFAERWCWGDVLVHRSRLDHMDDIDAAARVADVLDKLVPTAKTLKYC